MPTAIHNAVERHTLYDEEMADETPSVAQRSQQIIEESIQRHPGFYVGAALAAGVVLGCLVKRN